MILLFLAACGDVKPAAADTAQIIIEPNDTSIEEESFFEPEFFTMYSMFGVEEGSLQSFSIDGNEFMPYVQLVFYNSDQSENCSVLAFMNAGTVSISDWSFEDVTDSENPVMMTQQGFMLPSLEELSVVTSDGCADWNSDLYGTLEDKIDHSWGVGFGGPIRMDLVAAIQGFDSTSKMFSLFENGYLIGGSWAADLWEPSTWASHTFTVSPHENWVLSTDENGYPSSYYTASEIEQGIDSGIYIMNSVFLWSYAGFF
jgi:hypothetical protein